MKKLLFSGFCLLLWGCETVTTGEIRDIEQPEKDPAQKYYELGVAYIQNGQYDLAESRLLRSLENGEMPETLNALALLYEEMRDNRAAEQTYEKLIVSFPDYELGYTNFSIFLCKYNRTTQIENLITKMTNQGSKIAAIGSASAGDCAFTKGDFATAEKFYKQTLTYDQYSPYALLPLAEIDIRKGFLPEAMEKINLVHNYVGYSARSLYLATIISKEMGNSVNERRYSRELRSRFPRTREAQLVGRS